MYNEHIALAYLVSAGLIFSGVIVTLIVSSRFMMIHV